MTKPTTLGDLKRLDERVYQLAVQRTKEAGNEPKDELLLIGTFQTFDWGQTTEGWLFWFKIDKLIFEPFYFLYGKPEQTYTESQIREACESCVNNEITELIIKKLKER